MERSDSKISLRGISATGFVAALAYFLFNLALYFPSEQLALMGSGFLRFNLFMYSFSIWFVGLTLLAAVLYLITAPLGGASAGRGRMFARYFIIYLVVVLVLVTGFAVWSGYSRTAPLVPSYLKIGVMKTSAMISSGIAVLLALGLAFVASAVARGTHGRAVGRSKALLYVFLVCLIYVIAINLPVDYAQQGDGPDVRPSGRPRVVLFGVDAGSWNVILPFIERGDMPAFRKMMDEGTYGYFATYGQQYTPPSWTSIATGKKEEKHGIHTFSNVSTDWQAAPLWSIMSGAGRRVGVVNWVCTWPPFEVEGAFISRVQGARTGSVYFSEGLEAYRPKAEEILYRFDDVVADDNKSRMIQTEQEIDQLRRIDDDIMSEIYPEFLAYIYYATDKMQHFFWKEMSPELFERDDWAGEPMDEAYSDAIRETWILADEFLSDLMNRYGSNNYYVILSDHGARPVTKRKVDFDMNVLLEELGYTTRRSGEVHHESSVCYLASGISPHFVFDLKINPSEYTDLGEINLDRLREIKAGISRDLNAVRFKGSGGKVFEGIQTLDHPGEGDKPDIRIFASRSLMDMPDRNEMMVAGDVEVPVTRVLSYHPWSGRHRARGIVLVRGPGVEHRYTGAWTMDEPYTMIFRYSLGIFRAMDRFTAPLRKLHLVDEVTTLDVAPTLLYLTGLPIARDMDGRVLTEIIGGEFAGANKIKMVDTYQIGEILHLEIDPVEDAKMKERLKALGYIQ